jgi:hypothetical protein
MSATLRPRLGFLWCNVKWGAPDDRVSESCSYCGEPIADDEVPLRLWNKAGWACQFCRACMKTWWGMESFDDQEEGS